MGIVHTCDRRFQDGERGRFDGLPSHLFRKGLEGATALKCLQGVPGTGKGEVHGLAHKETSFNFVPYLVQLRQVGGVSLEGLEQVKSAPPLVDVPNFLFFCIKCGFQQFSWEFHGLKGRSPAKQRCRACHKSPGLGQLLQGVACVENLVQEIIGQVVGCLKSFFLRKLGFDTVPNFVERCEPAFPEAIESDHFETVGGGYRLRDLASLKVADSVSY